jgi:transcription elongation GreA/GreB family factor
MRPKLGQLLEKVGEMNEVVGKAARQSKMAADEASGALATSYSAAGDVEHARNSASLSMQKALAVRKLFEEIEADLSGGAKNVIEPACFVVAEFEDGTQKEFYLVRNPVFIAGFNLISSESPLGLALTGKRVGETFFYESGPQNFNGKVLEIE